MLRMILPLMILTSCATVTDTAQQGPDPKLTAELEGRVAGKSQNCIDLREASGSEIYRDAILYRASRSKYWLADAPGCGSSRANNDYILVQRVYGSQLCRGDLIRLVDRVGGFEGGACVVQSFTPYTKLKG